MSTTLPDLNAYAATGRFQLIYDHLEGSDILALEPDLQTLYCRALFFLGKFNACWSSVTKAHTANVRHPGITLYEGWMHYHRNSLRTALACANTILDQAHGQLTSLQAEALHLRAMTQRRLGGLDRATTDITDAISIWRTLREPFGLSFSLLGSATIALSKYALDTALSAAKEAASIFRCHNMADRENISLMLTAIIDNLQGRQREARETIDRALQLVSPERPIRYTRTLITRARVLLSSDDLSGATRDCLRVLAVSDLPRREKALALETLGDIAATQGDFAEARNRYQEALAIGTEIAPEGDIVAEVRRRIASLHLKEGDAIGAIPLLREAVAVAEKCGERFEMGLAQRDLSVAYLELKQYRRAIAQAQQSVELFREMGAPIEQARAQEQLAEASLAWHRFLASDVVHGRRVDDRTIQEAASAAAAAAGVG